MDFVYICMYIKDFLMHPLVFGFYLCVFFWEDLSKYFTTNFEATNKKQKKEERVNHQRTHEIKIKTIQNTNQPIFENHKNPT